MNEALRPPCADPVAVSVVVIGRNEGARLVRCLASVRAVPWGGTGHELIYVDSGSADDSVVRARAMGARTLALEDASPCAAKARNLGWRAARGEFVLFLDGDTELHPAFVARALDTLRDARLCAAWGHRRESRPEQSIYTRVLDLDWVYPTGRSQYFGGDVLVRRMALAEVGGFDPTLKAGEEPELCARLRAAGWEIEHVDAPMTRHDLALRSLRSYCLRAYRSGFAYAEVAERMRRRGDPMWRKEAARDFRHGLLFVAAPPALALSAFWSALPALALLALALLVLARTAARCAWKAPGRTALHWQYALHSHLQKVPAVCGQLAWRRSRRGAPPVGLVEYKADDARVRSQRPASPVAQPGAGEVTPAAADVEQRRRQWAKRALVALLRPLATAWRRLAVDRWLRAWSVARLSEATGRPVHPTNVILGPVELHGTRDVRMGQGALIYPDVYLETQGAGSIDIGDGVVLSRGVHIVAFGRVTLGAGTMLGEYASVRDADHRRSDSSVRHSGHEVAAVAIGRNVWIGRGAVVLKGVCLGENCVIGANSVVNRSMPAGVVAAGVPARVVREVAAHLADGEPRGDAGARGVTDAAAPVVVEAVADLATKPSVVPTASST